MKALVLPVLLFVIVFGFAACEQQKTVTAPEPVQTPAVVVIPKYSAQVFFETTSYGLTNAAGYAFSSDGNAVLMSSDASGVFNVYHCHWMATHRNN